jgi:hypothetical protein
MDILSRERLCTPGIGRMSGWKSPFFIMPTVNENLNHVLSFHKLAPQKIPRDSQGLACTAATCLGRLPAGKTCLYNHSWEIVGVR